MLPTDAGDFGWSEVAIEPIVVTLGIRSEGDFKAITNSPMSVALGPKLGVIAISNSSNPPTSVTLGGARGFLSNFQPIDAGDFGRSEGIS